MTKILRTTRRTLVLTLYKKSKVLCFHKMSTEPVLFPIIQVNLCERRYTTMTELSLDGIKKYFDTTLILKNVTFDIFTNEKVGLIGANGCGKSTVFKLIAKIIPMEYCIGYPGAYYIPGYDKGFINIAKNRTCAYLEQDPVYDEDLLVIDVLKLAFEEVYALEQKMRELENKMSLLLGEALEIALKQYSRLQEEYDSKGGYTTEEKLNKIATGLKFDDDFLQTKFALLSGGEKTKVTLGRQLMYNPDILLLDEPTNHLDMDSIEWLEEYIKNYEGVVMIISHDRYFLDNVVTKIIEIEDKISTTYKGNYSSYLEQKEENRRVQYEQYREQQKRISATKSTIKELREWAMKSGNTKFFKRAASMQNKLDRMELIDKPKFKRKNMKVDFKTTTRTGKETIKAINVSKGYPGKELIAHGNMLISYGERVALLGRNGSGKTTLLKMLLGEEKPDRGVIALGANVKAAYLPQYITFNNEEMTVLECFREDIQILEGQAREYLAKFMFFGDCVFDRVNYLSGGERIRLKLAKLLFQDINLLILDEPTNHLDIYSIEALESAFEAFDGTIFFISHDRYFINKIGHRIVAIEDKTLQNYAGNYDFYKKNRKTSLENQAIKSEGVSGTIKKTHKTSNPKGNRIKKRSHDKQVASLESVIQNLEEDIKQIDAVMSDGSLCHTELNDLYMKKESLQEELDMVMEDWLEALENRANT